MEIEEIVKVLIYIIIGVGLIISTITDIKSKRIHVGIVGMVSAVCFVLNIIIGSMNIHEIIGIFIIGILFLSIVLISGGQLGTGDVCIFLMTGVGIGIAGNIYLIFISFIIAAFAASYLIIFKKKDRKYKMPFVPYVMAGYVIYLIDKAGGISGVL